MNKPILVFQAPVATRSGYGDHSRDILKSLFDSLLWFENIFEIVIETNESDELNWNLFNLQGNSLQKGKLWVSPGTSRKEVEEENLPSGIYYLKIQNETGSQIKKVVVL